MAYSTLQTLIDQFGIDEVTSSSDRDHDGVPDVGVVEQAIFDADGEIDSYLGTKYKVPLNPVPPIVVTASSTIAMYRMSYDAATLTDEKRRRYEDLIRWLRDVASGKAVLDPGVGGKSSGGVRYSTETREYTRSKLGGIL